MAEYIKREAVLELIRPDDPNDERCAVTVATAKRLIRHALAVAPAADVAPVVHARWVSVAGKRDRICSRCLRNEPYKNADDDAEVFEFCPHCGAKMDGGANNEAD